jgi:hypothetical protein
MACRPTLPAGVHRAKSQFHLTVGAWRRYGAGRGIITMRGLAAGVGFLLAAAFPMALHAADTGISGQKIVLKSRGAKQKLIFQSKDPAAPFPPIGSVDDPSAAGLTIEVVTPGGVGSLTASGGTGWRSRDAAIDSYAFKGASSSPVRSIALKQGRTLKITTRSVPVAMTDPLGSVGLRLTMGGTRACALFDGATVVADVAGSFTAKTSAAPAECSLATLGHPSVCGNGVLEEGERCEATSDAACPGECQADCTCPPRCGDGLLDAGEQCDGATFGPWPPNECADLGDAVPACQSDCTCCATRLCTAGTFMATCCPGFACPLPLGPNDRTYCTPTCTTADDCAAGQICAGGMCATPHCTTNAECVPGACIGGLCCVELGGGVVACG